MSWNNERLFEFLKMKEEAGTFTAPYIAEEGNATKSCRCYFRQAPNIDAAQGYHFGVDDTRLPRLKEVLTGESGSIALFGDAVVDGAEEHIVTERLVLLHFLQGMTGAADVPLIAGGCLRIASVQVDAFQMPGRCQREMLVGDDAWQILCR